MQFLADFVLGLLNRCIKSKRSTLVRCSMGSVVESVAAKLLLLFELTKSCAKNVKEFILLQHFEAKIGNGASNVEMFCEKVMFYMHFYHLCCLV